MRAKLIKHLATKRGAHAGHHARTKFKDLGVISVLLTAAIRDEAPWLIYFTSHNNEAREY
jgi:hypothetical protein